jgi:hypothetical protein
MQKKIDTQKMSVAQAFRLRLGTMRYLLQPEDEKISVILQTLVASLIIFSFLPFVFALSRDL